MGQDWANTVYAPCQDTFGREIWINPVVSQPGTPAYQARGIYNRNRLNEILEDGSMFVEQETILDVLEQEFPVLPQQDDEVTIPVDSLGMQTAPGDFTITSVWDNGGGEWSLHLRKKV
ncbi:MAG TPA: hypothetical protein VGH47_04480 [Xanthobacteraceae bacterium]|jgi:hypothetical protein